MDYTVQTGKKKYQFRFKKSEVKGLDELLILIEGIVRAEKANGQPVGVLYDCEWRQIYDLKSFERAPMRIVYWERSGKASKLPSIGTNNSRLSEPRSQRTSTSTPGTSVSKLPSIPVDSSAARTKSDSAIVKKKKNKAKPRARAAASVDRNNNSSKKNNSSSADASVNPKVGKVSGRKHGKNSKNTEKKVLEQEGDADGRNEGIVRKCKFIIPIEDKADLSRRYKFDQVIGDGNFAVVSKCWDRRDGSNGAIKVIFLNRL